MSKDIRKLLEENGETFSKEIHEILKNITGIDMQFALIAYDPEEESEIKACIIAKGSAHMLAQAMDEGSRQFKIEAIRGAIDRFAESIMEQSAVEEKRHHTHH
ncbi:MAG: hypothetical protein GWN00_19790 [Aliifodinibius sp.]|nr:hypothetical protein [Fodinibius sp.]NIY26965.1 hypothetical protein [Fodinibius sp.]